MTNKFLAVTIIILVAISPCALAQQLPDSTAYNTALAFYTSASGEQSVIFSGNEYPDMRVNKGSVFFLDNSTFALGTVVYDDNVYKNVPVLYDSYKDVVVARRLNGFTKYILRTDKASKFQLNGHTFVRLAPDNIKNATKDGYYEVLYDGKSSVIAKRGKVRSETLSQQEGIRVIFDDANIIYIKKNDIYNPVKSRGDVLKLFKDKEDALKKYIKTGAVNFQDNTELAIIKLATYYDQISL